MGSPRGSAGRDRGDVAGRANAGQRETGSSPNDPASASVGELVVECARGNEKLRRLVATLLHPNGRRLCPHRRECGCLDHPLGTRGTPAPPAARRLLLDAAGRAAAPLVQTPLAAWAREIVSIDESTLDAVQRWLEPLRHRPAGDAALLAGKIAGRFNLRTQQWDLLQYRSNVWANCKVEVLSLLEGLMPGSLILFDLGYFSFAWFDYLTQMGYCYICRWREKTTYRIIHTYYRHHEILDAVVGSEPAKEPMPVMQSAWCALAMASSFGST